MTQTAFTGPLATFTHQPDGTSSGYSDLGLATLAQSATLTHNGDDTNVTAIIYLPTGAQILDFLNDNLTQWDSGTSATLTGGITDGGTEYFGSVNGKSAGRQSPTYSSAQLTAMANIGTHVAVHLQMAVVGATTAGITQVTVRYVQK